jgi:hypothetical protein
MQAHGALMQAHLSATPTTTKKFAQPFHPGTQLQQLSQTPPCTIWIPNPATLLRCAVYHEPLGCLQVAERCRAITVAFTVCVGWR